MKWLLALVVLLLAVVAVSLASADSSGEDDLSAARYLNPNAQLVGTFDLNYEGSQWLQVKRLYARVAANGLAKELFGDPVPATLDGALEKLVRSFGGLSFDRDLRPLLDGKLLLGVNVAPARPLSRAPVISSSGPIWRRRASTRAESGRFSSIIAVGVWTAARSRRRFASAKSVSHAPK